MNGSGDVPQEEEAPPMFEFDDADGELVDVAPPLAPNWESRLIDPLFMP